ncbi:DNA helicase IV [Paraburkholderia tropica]|uniref:UvrD-helicase domain-containing protein n=1 Tax=Paraburkholderia tropica TaxID=92647 RepID=UPI001CAC517F|nr:UvrD-helicase domain-containing protein [Paraburkholderia tropica]CAG9234304.1 DNA helicase IV [Paraburkholderia tropica]
MVTVHSGHRHVRKLTWWRKQVDFYLALDCFRNRTTLQPRRVPLATMLRYARIDLRKHGRKADISRCMLPFLDNALASELQMAEEWGPSTLGRFFTRTKPWSLTLFSDSLKFKLSINGRERTPHSSDSFARIALRPGLFWSTLTLELPDDRPITLKGLPNCRASAVQEALTKYKAAQRRVADVNAFKSAWEPINAWCKKAASLYDGAAQNRRWLAYEEEQSLLQERPKVSLGVKELQELLQKQHVQSSVPRDVAEHDLMFWANDCSDFIAELNRIHVERELVECKVLFDRVEKSPLTKEQARAVICFDNRVQVVAAAGSGKTSTMAAKAVYTVHRGFFRPEQILMLAFNTDAAKELAVRTSTAFARIGESDFRVEGRTFHSIGLSIIGKVTGRKPKVPDWAAEMPDGVKKLRELVDELKDRSTKFRSRWDLFRLVFGRDFPPLGDASQADAWNEDGTGKMLTLRGERVKSQEECTICDWLFYNGVDYAYERDYEYDTATSDHRQYAPDFYYPTIGLYHEHFALDANGRAPANFKGYLEGVAWKRAEHKRRGTDLIETTSHLLRHGRWEQFVESELASRGVVLDPNPDRLIPRGGRAPMPDNELIVLLRTFISHVKNNCLSVDTLLAEAQSAPGDFFRNRHIRFLELAGPVLRAWDNALAKEGGVDFDDMLNIAAEYVEAGRYDSPFRLVMADEFQDASRSRARLCRALVSRPGHFFFAVGDDWQAINRFAGADLTVMTKFGQSFGKGQTLVLEKTFRCPQELCDASSRFVGKNPAQLIKEVRSDTAPVGPAVTAVQVNHRDDLVDAIQRYLSELYCGLRDGTVPPGRDGQLRVFVLGRFRKDVKYVPQSWSKTNDAAMQVTFSTMHSSKGAEADYVILPAMLTRGFPDHRTDDPVLAMAMPKGDTFPLSEERRLFYVALTRARRSVRMFTVKGESSAFLDELVADGAVEVTTVDGMPVEEVRCPACKTGVIAQKNGKHGPFLGCSAFPLCRYKPPKKRTAVKTTFFSTTPRYRSR